MSKKLVEVKSSSQSEKENSRSFLTFSGQSRLEEALTGIEAAGKLTKRLADVQLKSAVKLSEWASDGDNTALDDVTTKMSDLMKMYTGHQKLLADTMIHNATNMRKIIELEEKVEKAAKDVEKIRNKERKMEAQMKKNEKRKSLSPSIRTELREFLEVTKEKEQAEHELDNFRKEMEVAKMFQFRREMKGLSESFNEFFNAASSIFKCNSELVELVPAISTEDANKVRYEGGAISNEKVKQVRRSLGASPPSASRDRRKSAPFKIL